MSERRAAEEFTIEQVGDVNEAWPELEPLLLGIMDYHRPWDGRPLRPDWAQRMRDHMAAQGVILFARDASGKAIGLLNGFVWSDAGIFDEAVGHVDNAYVMDDVRRHGAGAALLGRFESWCRERGATEIRLEVIQGNDLGFSFWQKSGYGTRIQGLVKPLEVAL